MSELRELQLLLESAYFREKKDLQRLYNSRMTIIKYPMFPHVSNMLNKAIARSENQLYQIDMILQIIYIKNGK
jgi:hypothetical protein